jgi:hypothetical protein
MDEQLQQLIQLQAEQNQLLRRYLWRVRFSLFGLLLMTTAVAIGLGIVAYNTRTQTPPFVPAPVRVVTPPTGGGRSAPAGDIQVRPTIPGTT